MVAQARRQHLIVPLAPLGGALVGLAAALAVAFIPADMIDDAMLSSGLPAILPAAAPPLGVTARLGLALVAAGGVGLLIWFLIFLCIGSRTMTFGAAAADADDPSIPVLRRADAHPDAPPRRPLFANQDLGTPFLDVRAPSVDADAEFNAVPSEAADEAHGEQPDADEARAIPDNLDTLLAAFAPGATEPLPITTPSVELPAEPLPPAPAPILRPQIFDPAERFETFELTPLVREAGSAAPMPIRRDSFDTKPTTDATIAALLERLERSVNARAVQPGNDRAPTVPPARPARSLDETLGDLRQMAMRRG